MTEFLLETSGLVKRYGGLVATNHVNFNLAKGEVHAIIGPNGAGKTTLLAQLAGQLRPTEGLIRFDGADITHLSLAARSLRGLARSFQITSLCNEFTVSENVALAIQARRRYPFNFWASARRDLALRDLAFHVLEQVGLRDRVDTVAGDLAHGEQRQLELAVAMATSPRVLLLDEPTAGLGRRESASMVRLLLQLKRRYSIVLVEHDIDAVFQLADRISVLVYGQCIATGRPAEIRADPRVREAYLGDELG